MDRRVAIEPVDQPQQFFGRGAGRRGCAVGWSCPHLAAGLLFAADIGLAGGVVAHQDGGQAGGNAGLLGKIGGLLGDFAADFRRQGLAVENRCCHDALQVAAEVQGTIVIGPAAAAAGERALESEDPRPKTQDLPPVKPLSLWMTLLLRFAGVFNLLAGTGMVVFYHEGFKMLGVAKPALALPVQVMGILVGLFGVGYLLVAANPLENRNILLLGFWSKAISSAAALWYVAPWAAHPLPW